MPENSDKITEVAELLKKRFDGLENKADVLKAVELKSLYSEIPSLPDKERADFGRRINELKNELQILVDEHQEEGAKLPAIDVTAPFGVNVKPGDRPALGGGSQGTIHPLMKEKEVLSDIFYRMGFEVAQSRELDDQYHMFSALNFPEDHPARDDYDTFMTEQTDKDGVPLVAPAHTSTMQNRILKKHKPRLEKGEEFGVVIPDRIFRNEDVDARHEHTFYQIEGIYVGKNIHTGHLVATVKTFLKEYFKRELNVKIQPFYFPFTEPSFEFAATCPFCESGCNVCSNTSWIELGGCGMIHPNVLKMADIDPAVFTGFAWGFGIDRLVMLKYNIEDVRHFHSGKLNFLEQFK